MKCGNPVSERRFFQRKVNPAITSAMVLGEGADHQADLEILDLSLSGLGAETLRYCEGELVIRLQIPGCGLRDVEAHVVRCENRLIRYRVALQFGNPLLPQ